MQDKSHLGDFTTDSRRLAVLTGLSAILGILSGLVAFILIRMIGLFTHVAYYSTTGWSLVAPSTHHLGWLSVIVPIVGGLIVGLLAKYGTDRIRGHGIPEAIQAILENDSVMEGRVALIKPVASAITIGTGGPFGAEGPIIMTGGAIGSLLGQFFKLSSLERRTLLVAGAAAGMSATFGSPISAVLLAVELLLFEWRPRSLVPVAVASAIAEGMRRWLLGNAPIFGGHAVGTLPWHMLIWAVVIGLSAGILSGLLTKLVYLVEDGYRKLPIHWMWWPAIGGLFVGLGGLLDPRALGVGYPTIQAMDAGHILWMAALTLLVIKAVIWTLALSSGTSGGVLAPLLMIGGALGIVLSPILPAHLTGAWATLGMAAMLGGTMRAPFTATIFAMETTHHWALLLPVFVASIAGMVITVIWVPRSILTEKVARRGVHVAREYSVHPLERHAVSQVMVARADTVTLPDEAPLKDAREMLETSTTSHRTYPVVNTEGHVIGIIRRQAIFSDTSPDRQTVAHLATPPLTVGASERVRAVVEMMAQHEQEQCVVVNEKGQWVGWITHHDVLKTWKADQASETDRRRILHLYPSGD